MDADTVLAMFKRQDDLREQQHMYLAQMAKMTAEFANLNEIHAKELRVAESDRINAIRAVDVGAVAAAAAVSATQATTLAAQVALSADALRTQVAASAAAAAIAQSNALDPIQKDIADLRKAQYEAQGQRTQVVETRDLGGEKRGNLNLIIAGVGLLIAGSGFILSLVIGVVGYLATR